jgi:hypothetical protein
VGRIDELIGAQRIVVVRIAVRQPVAGAIDEKCQYLFHDTYLLWLVSRALKMDTARMRGSSRSAGKIDY